MLAGIASTFSLVHDTVSQFSKKMASELKRFNYVTPTNFLELVAGYKKYLFHIKMICINPSQYFH